MSEETKSATAAEVDKAPEEKAPEAVEPMKPNEVNEADVRKQLDEAVASVPIASAEKLDINDGDVVIVQFDQPLHPHQMKAYCDAVKRSTGKAVKVLGFGPGTSINVLSSDAAKDMIAEVVKDVLANSKSE